MEQSFAIQILFNDTFSGARKDAGVLFFDMNRFSKSTFGSPATKYSGLCGTVGNAEYLGKISETASDAMNGHNAIRYHVALLFGRSGPTAIFRFVVSIVVDAVNRLAVWTFSYVSKKCFKVVPSFANLNSSAAVSVIPFVRRVLATMDHLEPTLVDSGSRHAVGGVSQSKCFCMFTTAGFGFSRFEVAIPNNSLFAVVAKAKACSYFSGFVNLGRRFRNNFKLSKPLSDDEYFGRHCIAFLSALFSGGRGHTTPTLVTILTFSLQPSQP